MTETLEGYLLSQGQAMVRNLTRKGKCRKCGECCSNFLMLSDLEIESIRKYISENDIKAVNHTGKVRCIDFVCPFLSMKRQCVIYEKRPQICRVFKCNQKTATYKTLTELSKFEFRTIDMRDTFFGDKQGLPEGYLLSLIRQTLFKS